MEDHEEPCYSATLKCFSVYAYIYDTIYSKCDNTSVLRYMCSSWNYMRWGRKGNTY